MVEFETLTAQKKNYGKNNFIEVARKKAVTEEGESQFISISKGYYMPDGTERFKRTIPIPDEPEMRNFVADLIKSI